MNKKTTCHLQQKHFFHDASLCHFEIKIGLCIVLLSFNCKKPRRIKSEEFLLDVFSNSKAGVFIVKHHCKNQLPMTSAWATAIRSKIKQCHFQILQSRCFF